MREINFEEKARELVAEVNRVSGRGITWDMPLTWHGIRGEAIVVPSRIFGVTSVKEMQAIIELAWAEHCLTNGVEG